MEAGSRWPQALAVASAPDSRCHQLHAGCGQRIRHEKRCPEHGPVDAGALVRGYEYARGQYVVLDENELDRLRPAADRALVLERFPEAGAVDPVLFSGRSLHLLPEDRRRSRPSPSWSRRCPPAVAGRWAAWPSRAAARSCWFGPWAGCWR